MVVASDQGSVTPTAGLGWLRELGLVALLTIGNLLLIQHWFSQPISFAFSAPVIPLLANFLGWGGVDFTLAVRTLLLVFYSFGPAALYLFVRELAGRRMAAWIAVILYSLPILRSRFEALVSSGDGAHIAALTLVPLVGFFLLRFLRTGAFPAAVATSLAILLVALTSPFGLFVLLAMMLVVTFSEMLLGTGRIKFLRFVLVLLFAAGLSAFWYNPEFVRLTLLSAPGQAVIAALRNLIPLSFFTVPILGAFGFLLFDKRPQLQPLFVALGMTILFGLISFASGLEKFAVTAQSRYLPEVSLSLAVLWGVVGTFVYDLVGFLPQSRWFPIPAARRRLLRKVLLAVFAVVILILAISVPYAGGGFGRRGRQSLGAASESPLIDITEIRERTGGTHRVLGFVISGFTGLIILGIWRMVGRESGER